MNVPQVIKNLPEGVIVNKIAGNFGDLPGQAIAELGNGNSPKAVLIDVENNATLNVTNLVVEEGNCHRNGMRVRGNATSYGPSNIDVTGTVNPVVETIGLRIDGDFINYSKNSVNLTVRGN
ncbi:unnamed protein product [Allacma fusca]|uniref:Uncharacterized protein n=1 Tax=Allacma fusca TaxID=39272 RepID=A0A8J2KYZ9_9HEXA|nr:unnamed protein product [Allacma fusca]